ncbi:MAG TPA: LysR substrate-binding domain-containing protein [Methylococcus sp.]|nr:LysR substrate-binding domain-containing protein [Methylococcus sp.]
MHLTLRQLDLFEAVARHSSFTRAAEEHYLTQSAVSIQIKRLEEQVGLPLFEHVGKRIYLTAAGKELHQAASEVLGRLRELEAALASLRGQVKGPLQIAVVTTAKYFMPRLLGEFLRLYPEVEPRLTVTNRANILERLKRNCDDLVVMGQAPEESNAEPHAFLDNKLVVVAHPGHPLARERRIPLVRLAQERFLVREPGSGTRMAMDRLFAEHRIGITPYMELGSSEAIKQGVMAGLGISILSLQNFPLERANGLLTVLDVEGFPLERRWYAVYLKGKRLSRVASTFLDFLLRQGESGLATVPLPAVPRFPATEFLQDST